MHQMPSLDAGLFGRLSPRFDPDRAQRGDDATFSPSATRVRADAGLDDEDDDLQAGLDDEVSTD